MESCTNTPNKDDAWGVGALMNEQNAIHIFFHSLTQDQQDQ